MYVQRRLSFERTTDWRISSTLWSDHCIQDTKGSNIIEEIDQSKLDCVIRKGWDSRLESLSGFGPPLKHPAVSMTELNDLLQERGITHLFVVGVAFDGWVLSTAIDAAQLGYQTFIISDGVNATARSEEVRFKTLIRLKEIGVELIGIDSEALAIVHTRLNAEANEKD